MRPHRSHHALLGRCLPFHRTGMARLPYTCSLGGGGDSSLPPPKSTEGGLGSSGPAGSAMTARSHEVQFQTKVVLMFKFEKPSCQRFEHVSNSNQHQSNPKKTSLQQGKNKLLTSKTATMTHDTLRQKTLLSFSSKISTASKLRSVRPSCFGTIGVFVRW